MCMPVDISNVHVGLAIKGQVCAQVFKGGALSVLCPIGRYITNPPIGCLVAHFPTFKEGLVGDHIEDYRQTQHADPSSSPMYPPRSAVIQDAPL